MSSIGKRMKEFALAHYSSIQEFAVAMKMSSPSLSQYFNGKREPGSAILTKLEKLGCSIDWLLTGQTDRIRTVNTYQVKENSISNNIVAEVSYPYHKTSGMYCLYADLQGEIIDKIKLPYQVLLIDSDRETKLCDEVIVLTKSGKHYYKRLINETAKVFSSIDGEDLPLVILPEDIESMHKVVSKMIYLE